MNTIDATEIVEKMSNQKINYDRVLHKMIQAWEKEKVRPRILIHSCCAPCSTYTLEFLTQHADVTIFFSNSNIHPESEYQRRVLVQIGMDIQKIYNTHYLPSDFKKNSGYQRSIEMCKEYDVYRQCYCGCVFASKQQGCDLKTINREAKAFVKEHQQQPKEA